MVKATKKSFSKKSRSMRRKTMGGKRKNKSSKAQRRMKKMVGGTGDGDVAGGGAVYTKEQASQDEVELEDVQGPNYLPQNNWPDPNNPTWTPDEDENLVFINLGINDATDSNEKIVEVKSIGVEEYYPITKNQYSRYEGSGFIRGAFLTKGKIYQLTKKDGTVFNAKYILEQNNSTRSKEKPLLKDAVIVLRFRKVQSTPSP